MGDPVWCPEIDHLSRIALTFTNTWDHEAHEGYRAALWEHIAPVLQPHEVSGWLRRREVIVEHYRSEAMKRMEADRGKYGAPQVRD